ncbi:MAG: hypothetical protein AAGC55_23205, partial [Myxococcota bacterium]
LFSGDELGTLRNSRLIDFSQAFSGTIFPDGGLLALSFFALPQQLLTEIGGKLPVGGITTVTISVELIGTLGDRDLQSQEFVYPIDVCNGCLVGNALVGACQDLQDPRFAPMTAAAAGSAPAL